MNKPNARDADKRVPVALGLMAIVLTLLGSQQTSWAGRDSLSDQSALPVFAAASAPSR